MSGHTKGPWVWKDMGYFYELVGSDGETICDDGSAGGEYGSVIDPTGGSDSDKANARLIAAAPDLLEALRRVDGFMADMAINIDGDDYPVSFLSVHNAVVSAIAKADG